MPVAKSQLDYWNGSAWVTAQTPANNNALIRFTLDEKMGQPSVCNIKVSNKFNNPFSNTQADYKGNLSGVFTDFQRIRVLDSATKVVLFYGRIYRTIEKHDLSYGNVIEVEAQDALSELKDMVTDGSDNINMTNSGDTYPTIASPTTAVGKRSGLIKGLVSLFSKSGNIAFTGDANRFAESATTFSFEGSDTTGEYILKKGGQKSVLSHINEASKDDPHTSAKKVLTYDYYVDPNFQSTSTSHEPASFLNYFKRGDRPSGTPETYALRIEYPTGGGLTRTGRIQPMMSDYDFSRPKSELFTDAVCHYLDEGPATIGGAANKNKGWDVEEKLVRLELVKVKSISGAFVWSGKSIGGGTAGVDSAEEVKSGSTVVGRIQFISATSGGSDSDPEYALISEATSDFPNTGTITGATSTGSSFQIVSRLRETFGINKTTRLGATSIENADVIREQAVSRLRRSSDSILRGRCRIMTKPWYYLDSTSTTVSSNTVTFGDLNPLSYGFRIGMTINKVSATGVTQSYGYATAVTSNSITTAGMSSSISSGDKIRLYVPIRASDSCYVINRLVNITGGNFQITEVNYTEDNGIINTELDVVGSNSGLGPPQNTASRLIAAVTEKENYVQPSGGTAQSSKVKLTCKFSQHATNKHTTVSWTAGELTVGANTYAISSGNQVFSSTGEHYLYYTGSGTGFSTATVAAYTTNKNHTIVLWVNVLSTSDGEQHLEFKSVSDFNFSTPEMGDAGNILNQGTIVPSKKLTSKSMEYFNADVVIKSSGDALTTYNAAGSAVTSFTIYFQDGTSATISGYSNPFVTLGTTSGSSTSESTDQYIFVDLSSPSSIQVTTSSATALGDTKVVLATCERIVGKDALVNANYSAVSSGLERVQKGLDAAGGSIGALKNGAVTLSNDIYFRTGTSGSARVEIVANGIKGIDSSNVEQFTLNASDGKGLFGGGVCTISRHGIFFPQAAAGASTNGGAISWEYGGEYTWLYRETSGNKILLTHGGSSPSDGALWIVGANVHAIDGDFFHGLTSLAPLYGGNDTTLHSHASSGVSLSANNTWTGVQTFNGGYSTFNSTVNIDGGSTFLDVDNSAILNCTEPAQFQDGLYFKEISTPGTPASTWGRLYIKADGSTNKLYYKDDAGTEHDLQASGGSGTINSGTTNRFAYYSGSTTLDDSNTSSTTAMVYSKGGWFQCDVTNLYFSSLPSGTGTDVVVSGSTVRLESSSRRYKENIVDLAVDSSKVYDLVPKTFKWRDREEDILDENGTITDSKETVIGETDFGLIAEEVHEILPELVIYNTANEPDAVRYKTISVLLIEEMKKLKARIEVLEGN